MIRKRKNNKIQISVITPAYKTEKVIENTLSSIVKKLDELKVSYEIICVVDGKVDGTFQKAKKLSIRNPKIKVFGYKDNKGKGYAVRFGFSKARGKYIGFIDSDGDIQAESIKVLFKVIKKINADAVVGSKNHKNSNIHYPIYRKIISKITQFFVRNVFDVGVSDTQAGVKIFKSSLISSILPKLRVNRFVFDLELLAVAKKHGYKNIKEAPIAVNMSKGDGRLGISTISFKDIINSFFEAMKLYYNLNFTDFYK